MKSKYVLQGLVILLFSLTILFIFYTYLPHLEAEDLPIETNGSEKTNLQNNSPSAKDGEVQEISTYNTI